MKVLQLFKNYYPPTRGGVEQWINDVVHSVPGIEFTVLTASLGRDLVVERDDGVRVVRAPAVVRASTAPAVPSWPAWIRRLRPDVIHVHMPNPTGELAVIASLTDATVVATYHADIIRRGPLPAAYARFAKRFARRAWAVHVSSPTLARTTPALREARTTVIPFGVDVERYATEPPEAEAIRKSVDGPVVLFLGRHVHYKGLPVLVEAMKHVEATLLVVGDGPVKREAERRARDAGVSHKIYFVGAIGDDERVAYYHAADVFVLPAVSRGEAFGIVQAEAMATGTPAISTELGTGTSWVNQHGETGLVVPPRDPTALARAINDLVGDPVRRDAMGRAAARRVREHFTRDRMLADLRSLYEAAAAVRGRREVQAR